MGTYRLRRCCALVCVGMLSCADQIAAQQERAGTAPSTTFRECSACPELVVIPAGQFTMGSSPAERRWAVAHGATPGSVADEAPQHVVAVRAFALGKYDVTRGEYERFVRETGYPAGDGCVVSAGPRGFDGTNAAKQSAASWRDAGFEQTARDPAVCVSWHDARAYVAWLNDKVRRPGTSLQEGPYRLPTEAEWEYAARGGTTTRFWWGDDDGDAPLYAWYKENASGRTHPVGSMSPNPFGLSDMVGDVWQWTEDCYAESYAAAPRDGSTVETRSDCLRVDRGGSWFYPAWLLRSAARERNPADYRDVVMGFRVARTMAPSTDSTNTDLRRYMRAAAPRVILEHVRVIDGTGAAPLDDRNVTIEHGRITAISAGADSPPTDSTIMLHLRGYSVLPGIVGMHEHLAYLAFPNLDSAYRFDGPAQFQEMTFSAPRLYLANGVTTLRTTASVAPYTDLKLRRAIEEGRVLGPHLDVTGPFLDGGTNPSYQVPEFTGPEDARQTVAFWADRGVTSLKAYTHITRAELRAVIDEAHRRGLKVTAHLCSVTYEEAADLGIDNLEHGFFVNTAGDPDKKPDTCSATQGDYTLAHMTPGSAEANRLIATLVAHHVALTSTLPGLAAAVDRIASADGGPALRGPVADAMAPSARDAYRYWLARPKPPKSDAALLLRRDMDFERAFVTAGGLLLAGADPVGIGGLVPGFADQREIELLVEAGFTPVQAIRIATLNGATFLGRQDRIGSIAVGKNADLVVVRGDPATRIADVENVEIVFKDGVGYDTAKLLASVKGAYGLY